MHLLLFIFSSLVPHAASFQSAYVSALDEVTNSQFGDVRYGFMSRERFHDIVKSMVNEIQLLTHRTDLEDYELHKAEKITEEIRRIMEDVRMEQGRIFSRIEFTSDVNIEKVRDVILENSAKFTEQLRGFNTSKLYKSFIRDTCLNSAPPITSAEILLNMLKRCAEPELDVALLQTIEAHLDAQKYQSQQVSAVFDKLKTAVYMHYEASANGVDRFHEDAATFAKSRGHVFASRDNFLKQILLFWKIEVQNHCLFKAVYLNSRFQRDNILDLLRTIEQDLLQLTFSAVFCSNASYPDDPKSADTYLNSFLEVAEPIRDWLDNWVNKFLINSWPGVHKIVATKFIGQYSMSTMENGTANELADELKKGLSKVGHASHHLEIIVTELEDIIQRSGKFFLESKPQNHWILLQNKVSNVLIVKTNTSDTVRLANLEKFVSGKTEPFLNLMNTKYYNKAAIADILYGLKSNMVDLLDFKYHNVLIGLHETKRWGKCPVKVGFSETSGKHEIQKISYYLPSGYFYFCQHFLFILV